MEIQKFMAPGNCEFRVTLIDGELWVSAGDVCTALGISDMRQALERLEEDERGVFIAPTPGGPQSIRAVSESGMYALIFQSRKEGAREFRKWVTSEVLPAIRKTGSYVQPGFKVPQTLAEALRLAADQQDIIDAQVIQIESQKPAVEFVDKFVEAKQTQPLRAVAKVLGVPERKFVTWLLNENILYRLQGRLTPKQPHLDEGRFEMKEFVAGGYANFQMSFTTKGVQWIAARVSIAKEKGEL